MVHQAGAYSGFCRMKWLGVFPLPPGRDASPSQGYPPALNSPVPIYTPEWREALWELRVLPKNTADCPRPEFEPGPLDPKTSALTMRPPHYPDSSTSSFLTVTNSHTSVDVSRISARAIACERRPISGCHLFCQPESDSRKCVCVRRLHVPQKLTKENIPLNGI